MGILTFDFFSSCKNCQKNTNNSENFLPGPVAMQLIPYLNILKITLGGGRRGGLKSFYGGMPLHAAKSGSIGKSPKEIAKQSILSQRGGGCSYTFNFKNYML